MKMGKTALLCVTVILMLLSGCMIDSGESFLALPELPSQYSALQDALDQLDTQHGYVSALAGSHRQPVQMIDLDADGTEEVVVFTLDSNGLCQVHVLRLYGERYALANSISGVSADLYEVLYPTITPDGQRGIATVWGRVQDESRGATVIALQPEGMPHVLTFSGHSYLFEDLDGDGADEIWFADQGGTKWIRSRLQRYNYSPEEGFYPTGRLSLAAEATYTVSLQAGCCSDGTPALFADSYTEDRTHMVTDLVVELDSGLVSLTQGLASTAEPTMRRIRALCTDINGDGVPEIPVDMDEFPNWLPNSARFLTWCDFSWEGREPQELLYTFYMPDEGLALVVPKVWEDGIRVTRWKDELGRTVYSFYDLAALWDEDSRAQSDTLVLRLCIGEAYKVDEMPYEDIVILEEIAVGYVVSADAPKSIRPDPTEIENGLHLLQDRW